METQFKFSRYLLSSRHSIQQVCYKKAIVTNEVDNIDNNTNDVNKRDDNSKDDNDINTDHELPNLGLLNNDVSFVGASITLSSSEGFSVKSLEAM